MIAPEPKCFRIEPGVNGHVPRRFIRREWLNWFIGNNKHLDDAVAIREGVIELMNHEFAREDVAKKEWTHEVISFPNEDLEIFIYHVERTRV